MALKVNPVTGQLDLVLDKASEIKYTPSGDLSSLNTQDAIDELESQLLSLPDPIVYKGTWDASTNTPTLSNSDIDKDGYLYQVNVAGTVDFGAGSISFDVGDKVVNNGSIWDKWDMTDAVASVNGQTGNVSLDTDNIPEGTNLYYTDERAQDAVGATLTNTPTIMMTYNDTLNIIFSAVIDGSITDAKIASGIDAIKIGSGTVSNTEFEYLDGVTSSIQTQLNNKTGTVAGDISKTTFSASTTATPVNITGAVFSNAVTRSFVMEMDVLGSTQYEHLTITGIQKGSSWDISQSSTGDTAGIALSITSAGQIQYISNQNLSITFRASTTGI